MRGKTSGSRIYIYSFIYLSSNVCEYLNIWVVTASACPQKRPLLTTNSDGLGSKSGIHLHPLIATTLLALGIPYKYFMDQLLAQTCAITEGCNRIGYSPSEVKQRFGRKSSHYFTYSTSSYDRITFYSLMSVLNHVVWQDRVQSIRIVHYIK